MNSVRRAPTAQGCTSSNMQGPKRPVCLFSAESPGNIVLCHRLSPQLVRCPKLTTWATQTRRKNLRTARRSFHRRTRSQRTAGHPPHRRMGWHFLPRECRRAQHLTTKHPNHNLTGSVQQAGSHAPQTGWWKIFSCSFGPSTSSISCERIIQPVQRSRLSFARREGVRE